MANTNGQTPEPRPASPRPVILTGAQARGDDGRLWVMARMVFPNGEVFGLIDPLDVRTLGEALVRFADLDQQAEKRLILPE